MLGNLNKEQLEGILEAIPVEITFVDENDLISFWNKREIRIFKRPISLVGKTVQDYHSKRSVGKVNQLLSDFRIGKRDAVESCTNCEGREIYVGYFPVRDRAGRYLGTLEAAQDITGINKKD